MSQRVPFNRGLMIMLMIAAPFFISCRSVHYLMGNHEPEIGRLHFVSHLPPTLNENSGLLYRNGRLWSFNDSGGDAMLYSFIPSDPCGTLQMFPVIGAKNTDWEDIGMDDQYIYISDAGNNTGIRDTLKIYQLLIDTSENMATVSSVISFSYPGKSPDFHDCRKNPFDSEALTVCFDSLWLFTKNWQDESSCIYVYPTQGGYYRPGPEYCLNPGMLVAGADFDKQNAILWLIGYHHFTPVIAVYRLLKSSPPVPVLNIRMRSRTGLQMEGIVCGDDGYIYISFERSKRQQGLFRFENPYVYH